MSGIRGVTVGRPHLGSKPASPDPQSGAGSSAAAGDGKAPPDGAGSGSAASSHTSSASSSGAGSSSSQQGGAAGGGGPVSVPPDAGQLLARRGSAPHFSGLSPSIRPVVVQPRRRDSAPLVEMTPEQAKGRELIEEVNEGLDSPTKAKLMQALQLLGVRLHRGHHHSVDHSRSHTPVLGGIEGSQAASWSLDEGSPLAATSPTSPSSSSSSFDAVSTSSSVFATASSSQPIPAHPVAGAHPSAPTHLQVMLDSGLDRGEQVSSMAGPIVGRTVAESGSVSMAAGGASAGARAFPAAGSSSSSAAPVRAGPRIVAGELRTLSDSDISEPASPRGEAMAQPDSRPDTPLRAGPRIVAGELRTESDSDSSAPPTPRKRDEAASPDDF